KKFKYLSYIKTNRKNLIQMSSQICGELENSWESRLGNILLSILPAGSVTGAPKKKTLEIIKLAEPYDRGWYTGIFGIFDGKNFYSYVMIRFIEKKGNDYYFKSGGGITVNSCPKNEYQEMINKVYVPIY
ncbi:MAG TPA: chorismate-binding protein, partial [Bacteroidales bacterium]|nr:chorismate-binding protein [Bacteroidales bacterium]